MSIQMPMQAKPIPESLENDIGLLAQNWYTSCKSAADCLLAGVLLVLSAPFMIVAMILVKLTSRGPVIYTQMRSGYQGETFRMYKIRSMMDKCEDKTGPQWAKPHDPRITRVGWMLRYSHIDELPQLWNVLRGEMSLIGPRPERPEIVGKLEQEFPSYRQRLLVRPGITGLAQIQLPPDTDLESVRRKLLCDIHYVQQLSLLLDLKILLATPLRLLGIPFGLLQHAMRIPSIQSLDCVSGMGSNEFMISSQMSSAQTHSAAR